MAGVPLGACPVTPLGRRSWVGRLECWDGGVRSVTFADSDEENSCCLQFQGRRAALIGHAERRDGECKKGGDVGSAHGSDRK